MRQLSVLAAAAALAGGLLLPASAGADPSAPPVPASCFSLGGTSNLGAGYMAGLAAVSVGTNGNGPFEGPASERRLRELLGGQFAGVWLESGLDGWRVGLSPGPLDLAAARALIVTRLLGTLPAAAAALEVAPEPYSWPELEAIQADIRAFVAAGGPAVGAYGIGCLRTGAFRLEVTVYDDTSAEQEASIRAFLAPYGDRIAFAREPGHGPQAAVGEILPPPVQPAPPRPEAQASPPARAGSARLAGRPRRSGATVQVRIACPRGAAQACAGRLVVRSTPRSHGRGAPRVLLTRSFGGLAPGRARTLTVRLTPRQRAALAGPRAGRLSAVVR